MNTPSLEFLKPPDDTIGTNQNQSTKIPIPPLPPIPDPSFLKNELTPLIPAARGAAPLEQRDLRKYDKEFDEFCRWAAFPDYLRKPRTAIAFEKKWGLPKSYTFHFRMREEYQQKRTFYFYEWFMDKWPNLVDKAYKRAMGDSTADFRVLAEMVVKKIDVEKPQVNVSPMVIIGVPQERIDKLFTPKGFDTPPKIIQGETVK